MDNALKAAKIAFYAALALLCVCAADTLKHVKHSADSLTTTLQSTTHTVESADRTISGVDAALNARGSLFDIVRKTALHIDRAAGEAAIASRQQRVAAERLDGEITATLQNVNGGVSDLRGFIVHSTAGLDGVVGDVHTALQTLPPLINATMRTATDLDKFVADPAWAATLGNVERTTSHIDATTADIQGSVHKALHPSKTRIVLGGAWTVVKIGATHLP